MDFINIIPSSDDINSLKNNINKREEKYRELIECLDEWKVKVINKIEELKKNLKYEIELMKKMFLNFNKYFINYNYFLNYDYFKTYVNNNDSIIYSKCYCYDDFENILNKLFKNERENKSKIKFSEMNLNYK